MENPQVSWPPCWSVLDNCIILNPAYEFHDNENMHMLVLGSLEDHVHIRISPPISQILQGKYRACKMLSMSEKERSWSRLISDALLLQAERVKKHEETWGLKKKK